MLSRCRCRRRPPLSAAVHCRLLTPPVVIVDARPCTSRPPPTFPGAAALCRRIPSTHPHPMSRFLHSTSISIPAAETLCLRPPLGGAISSLRRTSSRTLPELMLRDRRRSSLRRGMWKSALPPRCRGRLDGGRERMELTWTVEVLRPGGRGRGGSGGQRGTSHNKFRGEGTMGSSDGVPDPNPPSPPQHPTSLSL